eukprot:s641_g10.t1
MLRDRLLSIPAGHQPILMLDANSRFRLSAHAELPDNPNAWAFHALLEEFSLSRTAAFEPDGRTRVTWRPPAGTLRPGACLDYVVFPTAWHTDALQQSVLSINDVHAGVDHEPVAARVNVEVRHIPRPVQRIDRAAMLTHDGRQRIEHIYATMPQVPWNVPPDEHIQIINRHLQLGLLQHFSGCPRPRKPAMSEHTWSLLQARRCQRRVYRRQAVLRAKWMLAQCFIAWRRDTAHHVRGARRKLRAFDAQAACHIATMQKLGAQLRESHLWDEAEYVRATYADCREQGPAALAHKLRSVLRCGRGARPGGLPACLVVDDQCLCEQEPILQAFGDHFAKAEDASKVDLGDVPRCSDIVPGRCVQLDGAPALPDLASAFASLKSGKAAGISGLPPEVYSTCAPQAALCHMPLVLKALTRGRLPLLWTGMRAQPIPKPKKPSDRCEGYRSIALAEPAGKAVAKATRRELAARFEGIALPTLGGARPGFPTEVPAMAIRAHLAMLRKSRRAGSAVFLDGIAAFYSTNRSHLFTKDVDAIRSYVAALEIEADVKQRFAAKVCDLGALERAGVCPATVQLMQAAFTDTWFAVSTTSGSVYATQRGTVPGSPVADILFQFVLSAAMECLDAQLKDEGLAAQVVTPAGASISAPQSWLDDIALLLTAEDASQVAPCTARATALIRQYLLLVGVELNFAAGKSEAVLCIHGKGSTKAREEVMVHAGGLLPVALPKGEVAQLRCVDEYTHLGTVRGYHARDGPAIRQREQLARDVYPAFKRRILANRHLTMPERQNLLVSIVMARFLHGAGTLTLPDDGSQSQFRKAYMSFLKGAIRPLHGVPCRRLSPAQVCALTGCLLPEEALAERRIRVLSQLQQRADDYTLACLEVEGDWLRQAAADVARLAEVLESATLQSFVATCDHTAAWIRAWPLDRSGTTAKLRAYRKKCIHSRHSLIQEALCKAWAHNQVEVRGLVFACITPPAAVTKPHQCSSCGKSFAGAAQLAVHRAKRHGERALPSCAWGTACELCRRQYWSTARLKEHFRRSPRCAYAYQQAEVGDITAKEKAAPDSTPPTELVGPAPWWATLRPTAPVVYGDLTPASRDSAPDIKLLTEICQVPSYLQQWLGLVEKGLAWHSGVEDVDWVRPVVQLAAQIAEHLHLDDAEHFCTADGLSAVVFGGKILLGPTSMLRGAHVEIWPFL